MKAYVFKFCFRNIGTKLFHSYNGYRDCHYLLHQFFRTRFSRCFNLLMSSVFWSSNKKHAPDLSLLDYFLWGHVKEKVFQSEPSFVTALIRKVISSIQQDVLTAAVRNVQKRVDLCIEQKGSYF